MKLFNNYLGAEPTLEGRLKIAFYDLEIDADRQSAIRAFLELLRLKDLPTYEHSIRVGLLTKQIGSIMFLDAKALFYAGLLHDIGKALTNPKVLQKTDRFDISDYDEIKNHVPDGYRLLRGHFDFTAEVMWWHHRFQQNKYPEELNDHLHQYNEGTKVVIPMYGRLLSLADCFDAFHRVNGKFDEKGLSGEQIKEKMIGFNPEHKVLIEELYRRNIFTTIIIND